MSTSVISQTSRQKPYKPTLMNRVQTLLTSFVLGGHGFLLIFVALYFLAFGGHSPDVFGVRDWLHHQWNILLTNTIPVLSTSHWALWRHLFRDGGEKYLATAGVLLFTTNPYKPCRQLTSTGQAFGYLGIAVLAAIPLFVVLGLLLHLLEQWLHTGVLAASISAHPSLADKLYLSNWTTGVVAIVAGYISLRIFARPAYVYILYSFRERKVARGKKVHFWHVPAYRHLVNDFYAKYGRGDAQRRASAQQSERGTWSNKILFASFPVAILLMVYGGYILGHYAK